MGTKSPPSQLMQNKIAGCISPLDSSYKHRYLIGDEESHGCSPYNVIVLNMCCLQFRIPKSDIQPLV